MTKTVLQKLATGEIPGYPILQTRQNIFGFIDQKRFARPETKGLDVVSAGIIVFALEPVPKLESYPRTRSAQIHIASDFIAKRMMERLEHIELVIRHTEGRNLPDHAHSVLIPSYERRDGITLYEDTGTLEKAEMSGAQQLLIFDEEDTRRIEFELTMLGGARVQ